MMNRILLLLLALHGGAEAGEPVIGRLFSPASVKADEGSLELPENRLRVDGAVARSSNRNTVWLNGQAVTENGRGQHSARTSQKQLPDVQLDGRHRARVGETVDLDSGERSDMIKGELTHSGGRR